MNPTASPAAPDVPARTRPQKSLVLTSLSTAAMVTVAVLGVEGVEGLERPDEWFYGLGYLFLGVLIATVGALSAAVAFTVARMRGDRRRFRMALLSTGILIAAGVATWFRFTSGV